MPVTHSRRTPESASAPVSQRQHARQHASVSKSTSSGHVTACAPARVCGARVRRPHGLKETSLRAADQPRDLHPTRDLDAMRHTCTGDCTHARARARTHMCTHVRARTHALDVADVECTACVHWGGWTPDTHTLPSLIPPPYLSFIHPYPPPSLPPPPPSSRKASRRWLVQCPLYSRVQGGGRTLNRGLFSGAGSFSVPARP
jgi:hypothetical protein